MITLRGKPNWANLHVWCKAFHERKMSLIAGEEPIPGCWNRNAVLGVSKALKSMEDLEWAMADKVLMSMRRILVEVDKRWAD